MGKKRKSRYVYSYCYAERLDTWVISPYCYQSFGDAWKQAGRVVETLLAQGTRVYVDVSTYHYSPGDDEPELPLYNHRER